MEFDLLLLHAPSVYDFRVRDDVLFAYLSNSDSVHVSPIFEMPPVGVFAIEAALSRSFAAAEIGGASLVIGALVANNLYLRRAAAKRSSS